MDKKRIRQQILDARGAMSPEERRKGDILVTERILGHQWYYSAKYILIFMSFGTEIDTDMILEDAWHSGKEVYVPRVEEGQMLFHRIESPTQLQKGYRGIREPSPHTPVFQAEPERSQDTLMIMPGAAFAADRRRIGYGGGFYDRYLRDKPWLRTIAIGYKCQLLETPGILPAGEFPEDPWDIRPDQVICL